MSRASDENGRDTGGIAIKRCNTDPTGYTRPELAPAAGDYYDWQGRTGWEDETLVYVNGVNPFYGKDLVRAKKAHRFTPNEEAKMARFESIDYWEPNTKIFRENVEAMKKERRSLKWAVYLLIGFCVGMCAFSLTNTIEWLSERRRQWFIQTMERHGSTAAYMVLIVLSLLFVAVGTTLCAVWPHAAGSGVPDVMAYLNGVAFPKVFNISTFFGKMLSCALAVSSGLPVGPEGPLIHMGALIGAGVGQGRCKSLDFGLKVFDRFRTPKDLRDFITGGAAAGVACAFSAPIGGLLFVIEEISSFFSHKAMWMAFFASLMAIIVANTLNTKLAGWQPRDEGLGGNCTMTASWRAEYTVLFKANALPDVNLLSMVLGVVLGAVCGMFGAAFTYFNIKITRFRMNVLNASTTRRMTEPLLIVFLYVTLGFVLVHSTECKPKPALSPSHVNGRVGADMPYPDLELFSSICDDEQNEYHPLGTLFFSTADDCVRLLFRRRDPEASYNTLEFQQQLFPPETLALFCLVYMTFACWSAGTFLSCGLVIPMMVIGSSLGRLYGHLVIAIMQAAEGEVCTLSDMWIDPGVFALLGAAAFFAGVSRLTFSLCVIMLEITGDLPHLPNIMITVMAAKIVADAFTHPLYHALLELKCVPFLDFDIHLPYLDCYTASDLVSSSKLVTLPTQVTVEDLVQVLVENPHNAYPIVSNSNDQKLKGAGTLRGTVLRSQLEQVLWLLHDVQNEPDEPGQVAVLNHASMRLIKEKVYWRRRRHIPYRMDTLPAELAGKVIDLTPITNTSAFSIPDTFSVSATYTLFRGMGLRHLVVVNKYNSVVGMITRKDLLAHAILKHTIEAPVDDGRERDDALPSWSEEAAHYRIERQESSRGYSALQRAIKRSTSPGMDDSASPSEPGRSPGLRPLSLPQPAFPAQQGRFTPTSAAWRLNGPRRQPSGHLTLDRAETDGLLARSGHVRYGGDGATRMPGSTPVSPPAPANDAGATIPKAQSEELLPTAQLNPHSRQGSGASTASAASSPPARQPAAETPETKGAKPPADEY